MFASKPSRKFNMKLGPLTSGVQNPLGLKGGLGTKKPPKPKPPVTPAAPAGPPTRLDDATYQGQLAALERDRNDTTLGLQNREYATRSQYGFDPEFAANPYTRANMMSRAYAQRFAGTGNSLAAQGQLYSGALDRARGADAFAYGGEVNDARLSYLNDLNSVQAERLGAERSYSEGSDKAYSEMLARAAEKDPEAALFPAPDKGKGKGKGGGKKPKKPSGPTMSANVKKKYRYLNLKSGLKRA